MQQRLGLGFCVGIACMVACKALPDTGTCGNGLVELSGGEDCDGPTTPAESRCNSVCKFACDRASPDNPKCPGGYSCGADGTCRAPSGQFSDGRDGNVITSDAHRVDVADIDGDGFKDLVATSLGFTRVHYFNDGAFGETFEIPNPGPQPPILASLTARREQSQPQLQLHDLLFSAGPISVWQSTGNRTPEPTQYPTLVLGGTTKGLRVVFADTHAMLQSAPGAGKAPALGDETYFFGPRGPAGSDGSAILLFHQGGSTPIQLLRASAETLAGEVQVGDLNRDGCPEFVFAFTGSSVGSTPPGVEIFSACDRIPGGDLPSAPAPEAPPAIRFIDSGSAGGPLVVGPRGVLLTDFDGDGQLDVLVQTQRENVSSVPNVFVAYGVGDGHFRSTPGGAVDDMAAQIDVNLRRLLGRNDDDVFPLAAGQLTRIASSGDASPATSGDNLCDFVVANKIVLRVSDPANPVGQAIEIPATAGAPWLDAKIGDFNLDGFPDIAAVSRAGIDFYAGSNRPPVMTQFVYPVLNGAESLAVHDFDGDQALDFAFSSRSELLVAFGVLRGGPSTPRSMGRFPSIQRISAGLFSPLSGLPDGLSDIAVVGSEDPNTNSQFLSMLSGSVDRKLVSPYQLHHEGNPEVTRSLTAAVGRFDEDPHVDVAALGVGFAGKSQAFTLWKLPLTKDARVSYDQVRGVGFAVDGFKIFAPDGQGGGEEKDTIRLDAAVMAAVDLDPAGAGALDELVMIAPPLSNLIGDEGIVVTPGKLVVGRLVNGEWTQQTTDLGGGTGSALADFWWKVRVTDIDNDEAKDVILLFDEGGQPKLDVYFNNRSGRLENPVRVDIPGMHIVDCAWLHADEYSKDVARKDLVVLARRAPDGDPSLGEMAVYVVKSKKTERGFAPAKEVVKLDGPLPPDASAETFRGSLGAGDVDADGVEDILVATGNKVLILKGQPR